MKHEIKLEDYLLNETAWVFINKFIKVTGLPAYDWMVNGLKEILKEAIEYYINNQGE